MIGIQQGIQGCLLLLAYDLRIHIRGYLQWAEAPQDIPGQYRDASGHSKDTPDGYTVLAETHGLGLRIFISLVDVSLSIRDF